MGRTAVEVMVRRGREPLVVLASDAGASLAGAVRRLEPVGGLVTGVVDRERLAGALGRRDLAVVAVDDPGFVKGLRALLLARGKAGPLPGADGSGGGRGRKGLGRSDGRDRRGGGRR